MDPDPDGVQYGVYKTENYRGYGTILDPFDFSYAVGPNTKNVFGMYIPGNGFQHNIGMIPNWPQTSASVVLSTSTLRRDGDNAICCAWDLGTVPVGYTVGACCYYICGTRVQDIVDIIKQ